MSFPFFTLYHGTKFAVEGISEALSYELETIGVKMKLVEPGAIKTDFAGRSMELVNDDTLVEYQGLMQTFSAAMEGDMMANASEPKLVAEVIFTAVIFNPTEVADNMKKHGGFIPGIRPGAKTAEYIDHVLSRLTFYGAIYLSFVCILPDYLIRYLNIPFYFGGTSLLIVVGVSLDTMQQIESHLVMRNYDGFVKKGKIRSRRG